MTAPIGSTPLERPTTTGRRRPRSWVLLLATTPFLAGLYLLLPATGNSHVFAFPMYGVVASIVVVLMGIRSAPSRRRSWLAIALALALITLGDFTYSVLTLIYPVVPYPSLADPAFLGGYLFLIVGVLGLLRGRTPGGERTTVIDAAIVTTGVVAAFWITVMLPSVSGASDPIAMTVSLLYPGADLFLLIVGAHALLAGAVRTRFLQFVMAGLAMYFVADVVYAMAVIDGTYVFGGPVDLGWILGILLIGVGAIHPSAREPVVFLPKAEARLRPARLVLLAIAAFLSPVLLLANRTDPDPWVITGLVTTWTILFGLVLIRLATTVDELGSSLVQRQRLQDDLAHQATHDSLTRLANRSLFESRLEAAVAHDAHRTGLIFLDLDDFKTVNDTLGHPTGDALLRTLAARIQRELRRTDLGARIGGDEFAILVEDCPDEASLRLLAERILAVLRAPVALSGRHLVVHASAGIAFGSSGASGVDLMRDADVAMYQAKLNGKDQVERHEPAMHDAIVRGYQLRTELAAAVDAKAFTLNYQPVVNLQTGVIVAGEALVRWVHPERGVLLPAEFIGMAESTGLIHELGRWILREACLAAVRWPALPDGRSRSLGVNVSPAQLLEPGFAEVVAGILRETGLDPKRLTFELTESALIDLEAATAALQRISNLGIKLALDDFGIGYSALSYLADLPFDIVKVDQSFVSGMEDSERVEAILGGILALCRSLGLLAVAEGVETEAQLERLRRLGCPEGQGFLFARPMPLAAFEALLVGGREGLVPKRKVQLRLGGRSEA